MKNYRQMNANQVFSFTAHGTALHSDTRLLPKLV